MSNYKLTFKLKQHTPIIHFQHNQHGATLRASEVKPKLDRFLIERLKLTVTRKIGGKDKIVPKKEYEDWFINKGKQHLALDYKMKIEIPNFQKALLEEKKDIKIITEAEENSLLYKGDILMKILVFNSDLKKEIDGLIEEFFIITSFGKRQNKGFGCFYKLGSKFEKDIRPILNNCNWYLYTKETNNLLSFNNGFAKNYNFYVTISKEWRMLKSGFNHNNYVKSSVFKYLCNQGLRWDKRWIKKELKRNIAPKHLNATQKNGVFNEPNDCGNGEYGCNNEPNYNNWTDNSHLSNEYRFGRAMLGLAEHYEFKSGNTTYQVQVKSDDVERYKAPVTFKVFDNRIFAIAEDQDLFDKKFIFKVKVKEDRKEDYFFDFKDKENKDEVLKTPNQDEWNLVAFLDTFFPCVNFDRQDSNPQ